MSAAGNANAYEAITVPDSPNGFTAGYARQVFIRTEPGEAMLERVGGALFALDHGWCFTYLNRAAEALTGMKRETCLGRSIREVLPVFCRSLCFARLLQAAGEERETEFETSELRDGAWLAVQAIPSADGLTVYCRDITAQKQAALELRRAEERFAVAFNAGPNMMSIISCRDLRYLEANASWLAGMGYARAELIGRRVSELNIWADKYFSELLTACAARRESRQNCEVTFRNRAGEVRTGLAAVEPVCIDGEDCVLSVVNDITPLRRLEKEVARLDRLNLVGQMAAGLGHEIRNPLTVVRGYVQLLAANSGLQDFDEYFALMLGELDQANRVISEYLSLARDRSVRLQEDSLNEILAALRLQLEETAASRDCRVVFRPNACPAVRVDREEIRQLVQNLADNGLEAMPAGGELTIRTETEDGQAVLTVRDEGSGIPPEIYECLGTPFVTTKENGTGLGLAICYSIAARHSARIEVETGPAGTVFSVRFPGTV